MLLILGHVFSLRDLTFFSPQQSFKMNEAETGIEKELISFFAKVDTSKSKYLEVKYVISGSTFNTQLPFFLLRSFRESTPLPL